MRMNFLTSAAVSLSALSMLTLPVVEANAQNKSQNTDASRPLCSEVLDAAKRVNAYFMKKFFGFFPAETRKSVRGKIRIFAVITLF